MAGAKVELSPIRDADIPAVARFLNDHLNARPGVSSWTRLVGAPWAADAPNHGYLLSDRSGVVGAYVAVYSDRLIRGEQVRFCNLAAFCVAEDYRSHSLRLVRALLGQPGYVFTDLSPSGNVVALNERLGFQRLDTATRVVANLPSRRRAGCRLIEDHDRIRETLTGPDLELFLQHDRAPAARHLVVASGDRYAYLVYRRDRRKRLPWFASPLYVGGDAELLRREWRSVGARLLRHGLPFTLAERRLLGFVPSVGWELSNPRPKMYRGDAVGPDDIDYLFSELVLLQW